MNDYRIKYRFNKHGRKPHVFDIVDDTGHCITSFSSLNAEEAKADARNFVEGKNKHDTPKSDAVKNKLITIGWLGVKRCYLNISREEAVRRYVEKEATFYTPEEFAKEKEYIEANMVEEFEFDDEFEAYDAWGVFV